MDLNLVDRKVVAHESSGSWAEVEAALAAHDAAVIAMLAELQQRRSVQSWLDRIKDWVLDR